MGLFIQTSSGLMTTGVLFTYSIFSFLITNYVQSSSVLRSVNNFLSEKNSLSYEFRFEKLLRNSSTKLEQQLCSERSKSPLTALPAKKRPESNRALDNHLYCEFQSENFSEKCVESDK